MKNIHIIYNSNLFM